MGKLTSIGKHTVNVGNHPHTNMIQNQYMRGEEYKSRISEVHLKLRDQQLKTILYIYNLYQNLIVTEQQKTIYTLKKKKESNTTLNIIIKSQEKKNVD